MTAHVGDLRSLRYLMRREIPIATVVVATDEERADLANADRLFDLGTPRDFPHVLSSRQPHRLRSALRRGSLIVSADLPEQDGASFPCLGGQLRLDPRPFRLARLCARAVPSRLPDRAGRSPHDHDRPGAAATGGAPPWPHSRAPSKRVCDESPFAIDAFTWWNRLAPR